MNSRLLLVIVDAEKVNQPALTTALQAFDSREFVSGSFIVKTNQTPQAFVGTIGQALRGAQAWVFPLDEVAIRNATLPDEIHGWAGVTRAA